MVTSTATLPKHKNCCVSYTWGFTPVAKTSPGTTATAEPRWKCPVCSIPNTYRYIVPEMPMALVVPRLCIALHGGGLDAVIPGGGTIAAAVGMVSVAQHEQMKVRFSNSKSIPRLPSSQSFGVYLAGILLRDRGSHAAGVYRSIFPQRLHCIVILVMQVQRSQCDYRDADIKLRSNSISE